MTDTGGQGLPALPILAHGKSQGFHLTTPLQDRETPILPIAGAETMGVQVAASLQAKPCVFARAKPGRAASPFAAGNRDVQGNVMGDADAIQPGLGETCVRTFPATSFGMTDTGGQGLPALPILAHGKSQGFHLTTPLQDRETPILPIAGAETMGVQVAASLQAKPCVFARAKPGRAASPFAAGNRDVQGNVMGDADAIQPGLGETCVRTFPATSFGMTDTGGQGLPALPILAHGKSQGFHLTTPLQDRETPILPIAGAEPRAVRSRHAIRQNLVFSSVQSRVGRRVPSPPETGTCKGMSWVMRMPSSRDLGKRASAHFRRRPSA